MSELENWVEKQLKSGRTSEEVREALENEGYDPRIVDEVLGKNKNKKLLKGRWALPVMAALLLVLVGTGYLFLSGSSQGIPDGDNLVVRRNMDNRTRPGTSPEITLKIEGDYKNLELEERIPEGLRLGSRDGGSFSDETRELVWEVEGEQKEIEYRVTTPGASTGDYYFNGTYTHEDGSGKVGGDQKLEVRW